MSLALQRFCTPLLPCLFLVALTGFFPTPAFAADLGATTNAEAVDALAKQDVITSMKLEESTMTAASKAADDMADLHLKMQQQIKNDEMPKSADFELANTMKSQVEGDALSQVAINDIMGTRVKELNGVSLSKPGVKVAPYLLDTTSKIDVKSQMFRIYISYFCDPLERGGALAFTEPGGSTPREYKISTGEGTGTYYNITCGGSEDGNSREAMLGSGNDTGTKIKSRNQIKGLPIDVSRLFFEPTTYPKIDGDNPNGNPVAALYFGAIMQSIQFLTGLPEKAPGTADLNTPAGKGAYVEFQRRNTRKALASYPFAALAAERMSTMTKETAQKMASMLEERVGSENENVSRNIQELRDGTGLSLAEYQKILMHDIPTSAGYVKKIKEDMNERDLKGELVYLEGLSLAQGFELGKWMRVLMALEAADNEDTLTSGGAK